MKKLALLILLLLPIVAQAAPAIGQAATTPPGTRAQNMVPIQGDPDGLPVIVTCQSGCTGGTGGAPLAVTTHNITGTITTGGTAQNAISSNSLRKGWCVQNSSISENLIVVANGTASPTVGLSIQPGSQACNQTGTVDQSAISVYAATTGHPFTGWETQ